MRIGIITINDYGNFGNRLQNYALSYLLKNRFHCRTYTLESYNGNPLYKTNFTQWFMEQIGMMMCRMRCFAAKHRRSNFRLWSRKHIPIKRYYNVECLPTKLNESYDYFFVGSDQVWNYHFEK